MCELRRKFYEIVNHVSMFCTPSQSGDDFTIMSMFDAKRAIVLLTVKRRDEKLIIEFEEDAVGLQRITGTFDVRRANDALKFVEVHIEDFRAGRVSLSIRDFEPIEVTA